MFPFFSSLVCVPFFVRALKQPWSGFLVLGLEPTALVGFYMCTAQLTVVLHGSSDLSRRALQTIAGLQPLPVDYQAVHAMLLAASNAHGELKHLALSGVRHCSTVPPVQGTAFFGTAFASMGQCPFEWG